jgi:signal transduction histidine kinase
MAVNAVLKWLPWIDSAYMLGLVLYVLGLAVLSVRRACAHVRPGTLIVAALFVMLLVCGLRDAYVYVLSGDSFTATAWLRFGWIALGLSFAWITVERLRHADLAMSRMNDTLSTELTQRNAELEAAFERERKTEKARGATEERQRLMQDLHDGLGSHLLGIMRMAQAAKSSKPEIAAQLQEAIDQMKVTVDAMQETEGDIAVMLGAVRYRLAPRLQAAGIRLEWDVPRLPALASWTARQAYQLQMLLLEAFTNMMNHSGATLGQLSASLVDAPDGRHIVIEVQDNGRASTRAGPRAAAGACRA